MIFGVKNYDLMNVFDIVNVVTTPSNKPVTSTSAPIIKSFFSSSSFQEINKGEPVTIESVYGKTIDFISSFYNCDTEGILRFLKEEDMKQEYTFIISYYCYVGVLNGCIKTPAEIEPSVLEAIATCLCFPMIQQIYSSLSQSDQGGMAEIKISAIHNEIVNTIYDMDNLDFLSLFIVRDDRKQGDKERRHEMDMLGSNIDLLLKGELFLPFEKYINTRLKTLMSDLKEEKVHRGIKRLKDLYLFKPEFYRNPALNLAPGEKSTVEKLIRSAYTTRDTWEKTKSTLLISPTELASDKSRSLMHQINESLDGKCDFRFMNVDEDARRILENFIMPTMVFVFIYLRNIRSMLDTNDNNARVAVIRHALLFIWQLFDNMSKEPHKKGLYIDPIQHLRLNNKKAKISFLNRYTGLLYYLKVHKSDIFILRDLLTFVRNYVFNKTGKQPEDVVMEPLISDLKLDSFMELYDYLEELESGRETSENYKENIVNLFVQIVSQYDKFKKHIADIKHVVKLFQGDFTQVDYFVEKLFTRSQNVS